MKTLAICLCQFLDKESSLRRKYQYIYTQGMHQSITLITGIRRQFRQCLLSFECYMEFSMQSICQFVQ